ncbi:hypothetical protein JYU34_009645 [Plutella xylostella]|uniref:Uncharacterized protein n=1 Tax=Plutella xylostella TaxID=51655 RepID=A0ABQ7QK57_PLUXY|nr:hypothetical protein JYU34_009645 [Plutella xylostella]
MNYSKLDHGEDCVCCKCISGLFVSKKPAAKSKVTTETTTSCGSIRRTGRNQVIGTDPINFKNNLAPQTSITNASLPEPKASAFKKGKRVKKKIKFEKEPPTLKEILHMPEQKLKIKFKAPATLPYVGASGGVPRDGVLCGTAEPAGPEEFRWVTATGRPDCEGHVCCRCPDPQGTSVENCM